VFGFHQLDSEHKKRRRRRNRNRSNKSLGDDASTCATLSSDDSSSGYSQHQPQHRQQKTKKGNKSGNTNQQQQQASLTPEEQAKFVAFDCEFVGTGKYGKRSSVARVTLVAWDGAVILDEMVQQQYEVTDLRTFVSGITQDDLDAATWTFDSIRRRVSELIQDKILVGHALKNDLRGLNLSHPWYNTRDTAKYEPFMQIRFDDGVRWPKKLSELTKTRLGREIQQTGVPHCPREDAMAALDLYKLVRKNWEKAIEYKLNKTREIEAAKQQKQ
ncbi:MAG: hypothetical protein SGILL_000514, partial [Bacillariaceae sp.]